MLLPARIEQQSTTSAENGDNHFVRFGAEADIFASAGFVSRPTRASGEILPGI